jgi:hypothetical protein
MPAMSAAGYGDTLAWSYWATGDLVKTAAPAGEGYLATGGG